MANRQKPYHVLLIPSDGQDARKLRQRFHNPDTGVIMGKLAAATMFPQAATVEIVVIQSATREAVRNEFIEGGNNA